MRAARKQHELRAGNDRRQQPALLGTDRQVVSTVHDQRRDPDLPVQVPPVSPPMKRLVIPGRRLGVGRHALQLVEVRDQPGIGIAAEELAGEDLPEAGVSRPQPLRISVTSARVFLRVKSRSGPRSAAVGAVQDEVRDSFRMLIGEGRCRPSALGDAEQRRPCPRRRRRGRLRDRTVVFLR